MRIQLNGCGCLLGVALLIAGFTTNVIAEESGGPSSETPSSETEQRYLIVITTEIENIKALAQKAASTADAQARLQFDYAALERDLNVMQTAIEQHVKAPSRSPRSVKSLATHYTKK